MLPASRRLAHLKRHLIPATSRIRSSCVPLTRVLTTTNQFTPSEPGVVSIGDVSLPIRAPTDPLIVPYGYHDWETEPAQELLGHLRWIMQKDKLHQDVFLVGPPGPLKRWIALQYCELMQKEMEFVALSRDTTEADLKQRREIVDGNAIFVDQAPVRAALHGRTLVIDGIEKAERNVLPTLNNLLENREMSLDDGRFLMSSERYDQLLSQGSTQEELSAKQLVRVHPDFRVIALGLPVPPFPGKPLDPPLRSRFQARDISSPAPGALLQLLAEAVPALPQERARALVTAAAALRAAEEGASSSSSSPSPSSLSTPRLPHFPDSALPAAAATLALFPQESTATVLSRLYPLLLPSLPLPHSQQPAQQLAASVVAAATGEQGSGGFAAASYRLDTATALPPSFSSSSSSHTELRFSALPPAGRGSGGGGQAVQVTVAGGPLQPCTAPSAAATATAASAAADAPSAAAAVLTGDGQRQLQRLPTQDAALVGLLQDAAVGRHSLLLGGKGVGKSAVARLLAHHLGYDTQLVSLFQDMSARELVQRRATDGRGNTVWERSALVRSALRGSLCVLDGVQRLPPDTLAVLQRLLQDGELELFDGTRLVRHDRYDAAVAAAAAEGASDGGDGIQCGRLLRIHPSFRVLALGLPPTDANPWLTDETTAMFGCHHLPPLTPQEHRTLLTTAFPSAPATSIDALLSLVEPTAAAAAAEAAAGGNGGGGRRRNRGRGRGRQSSNSGEGAAAAATAGEAAEGTTALLSTRQLLRVCRRLQHFPDTAHAGLSQHIYDLLLADLLPPDILSSLRHQLSQAGIVPPAAGQQHPHTATADAASAVGTAAEIIVDKEAGELCIGGVCHGVKAAEHPELVPNPVFFDIPRHVSLMQDMLRDLSSGERHLLLIGNQGVGKNKLADRMLQLLQTEREYIQLHRDSTVGSLTLSPSLRDGAIVWEDSPLVRAVTCGRTLVVDEADKAPLEVVCVLKGLVEDGELLLADGRRLVHPHRLKQLQQQQQSQSGSSGSGSGSGDRLVAIHPDFRMWVLANRPGFPFLGNNFFGELGDVFCSHTIPNPDPQSELGLLSAYAPDVPQPLLRRLVSAFAELRQQVADGKLSYPYSTREAVAVVRHLQQFPNDGVVDTLENVLAFDSYDPALRRLLSAVFTRHDIPVPPTAASALPPARVKLATPTPLPATGDGAAGGGE